MRWSTQEFSIPLRQPLSTARGAIEERNGWIVRVGIGDRVGIGSAVPLPGWTESDDGCEAALTDALDALAGCTALDEAEALFDDLDSPAARHGLSGAALDLRARRSGQSLAAFLTDGSCLNAVPVNATVGDGSVEATTQAVLDALDDGFGTVKCKIGARALSDDRARIEAVREAAGPAPNIRVDANGAWSRSAAESALDWLTGASVEYLEQPLHPADLDDHQALRDNGVPIALDESLGTVGVDKILDSQACDVLVLKPMALGGIDRTVEVARRARARGCEPVVTTTIDDTVATAAAVHAAAAISPQYACGLGTRSMLASSLVEPDPIPVENGAIRVPAGDGLGIDPSTVG